MRFRELSLLKRMEWELKPKHPVVSKRQVEADWQLLQRSLEESKAELRAKQ